MVCARLVETSIRVGLPTRDDDGRDVVKLDSGRLGLTGTRPETVILTFFYPPKLMTVTTTSVNSCKLPPFDEAAFKDFLQGLKADCLRPGHTPARQEEKYLGLYSLSWLMYHTGLSKDYLVDLTNEDFDRALDGVPVACEGTTSTPGWFFRRSW